MRIALFDWTADGHHPIYVRRFAETFAGFSEVVVAAPDQVLATLADLDVEIRSLGEPRPREDHSRGLRRQAAALAERELDLLEAVAAEARVDHLIHLYGDWVLRRILRRPPLALPTTIAFFFPTRHYPKAFGSRLSARERARGLLFDFLVQRWRRRPEAHAVLGLDPVAVERWSRSRGAPAYWLPEPPVPALEERPAERSGCVLYGALSHHKGVGLLARAMADGPATVPVTLAGPVQPEFRGELDRAVAEMRAAGVSVELRSRLHGELAGLGMLAAARCALLPYPRHTGMSRVLLEAASVGTPVIVNDFGLLGDLVRRHGIGLAVDCADPAALRAAIERLAGDPDAPAAYADSLGTFAARYSPELFAEAVTAPFAAISHPRDPQLIGIRA
jgi:glycosyltransferase involved in cell wall biosynthesis